ncbi:MAG: YdcF family protein [Candidatus Micrarchaeales archaeon]|nr:YdcF family protein [Candidatus Micrarchaeales archaeon]
MTKYALLFGFGLFDQSNPKYKAYVDRFAKLVNKKRIEEVVLCGGHTDKNMLEKSEAGTIAEYLKPLIGANVKVHIEDQSLTTEQNIKFAKQFVNLDGANRIIIVSDAVRFFKIFWIVLDRWFNVNREEVVQTWYAIIQKVYDSPKKKGTAIELKDIKRLLEYKNVKVVIDNYHKDYKNGMHTIISEPFEIEALYNQQIYDKFMDVTMKKFKLK